MSESLFFQLVTLIVLIAVNTAVFIWRLVAVRDALAQQITLIKTALDLEVDVVRREVNEHRVKIAEEYIRQDSFYASVRNLEALIGNGINMLEARHVRLDEKVSRILLEGRTPGVTSS